jgi:hypothetical protein
MREGSREAFQAQAAYSSQNNLEICQQKLPLALDTIDYGGPVEVVGIEWYNKAY